MSKTSCDRDHKAFCFLRMTSLKIWQPCDYSPEMRNGNGNDGGPEMGKWYLRLGNGCFLWQQHLENEKWQWKHMRAWNGKRVSKAGNGCFLWQQHLENEKWQWKHMRAWNGKRVSKAGNDCFLRLWFALYERKALEDLGFCAVNHLIDEVLVKLSVHACVHTYKHTCIYVIYNMCVHVSNMQMYILHVFNIYTSTFSWLPHAYWFSLWWSVVILLSRFISSRPKIPTSRITTIPWAFEGQSLHS